ncbi:MAG: hypothetical protein GY703_16255 [Gammaproteobacteria bacterium]|nr:hypothetical protein [Gammaproteobacteria bacterium]
MNQTNQHSRRPPLKSGPVIFQSEDNLLEEDKRKKDMTLSELNHVFRLYLTKKGLQMEDISILGLFSVIFNDPRFSRWHELSKSDQSNALTRLVVMPEVYDELILKIGATAGDAQIIKSVVKDAYQNAIDSFSHAAYVQRKYDNRFPGFKVVLFLDQIQHKLVLTLVDNGFGKKIIKPKKSHTGQDYGDDFVSRITDWLIRRYVEKEGPIEREISYTGGQGMAMKKLRIELGLNIDLHFLATGAIFELKLKNFF